MKILLSVSAIAIFLFSCKNDDDPIYDVMYRVKGTSRYHKITYVDSAGTKLTIDSVRDHWEKGFFTKKGAPLYLEAQNLDTTGTIITSISVNGTEVKNKIEIAPKGTASVEAKAE
jgi:hypothetical protein